MEGPAEDLEVKAIIGATGVREGDLSETAGVTQEETRCRSEKQEGFGSRLEEQDLERE